MGVSIVMGDPQFSWMVYFMENPSKIDELLGCPYDLGNLSIWG